MPDWENVVADGTTQRLAVPGGWLYATAIYADGEFQTAQIVFVPHPPAPVYVTAPQVGVPYARSPGI